MNRWKELRKERGLTIQKMQMLTGINKRVYSKIEKKKIDYTTEQCLIIAQALGTSMDYLVGLTDKKEPYPRKKE